MIEENETKSAIILNMDFITLYTVSKSSIYQQNVVKSEEVNPLLTEGQFTANHEKSVFLYKELQNLIL